MTRHAPRKRDLPLVSVVIPVYNSEAFLVESIDSVIQQDYQNVEIIAVDDGSIDRSRELLRGYGDRIRLLTQENKGPAAARNAGIAAATGEFIAFQDADDVWLSGKLSAQMHYLLDHPDIGIVFGEFAFWCPASDGSYCDPSQFSKTTTEWHPSFELSGWIYADELLDSQIAMITPVVRREIFSAVGKFDENLRGGSDYDFWLRATFVTRCHKLRKGVALYRLHGNSVTTQVRSQNYPYIVLKRAIDNQGLIGPDGRSANASLVLQRLQRAALDYFSLHIEKGSIKIAWAAGRQYLTEAGVNPRSLSALAKRFAISLARRFTRFETPRPTGNTPH